MFKKPRTHCFVVLVYEPKLEEVTNILRSLGDYEVFLIDNTERPEKKLSSLLLHGKKTLPDTVYLTASDKNLGYAGGINLGLKQAFAQGYSWMTLMNIDLHIKPNAIKTYLEQLLHSPKGIAGVYPGYLDPWRWSTILPKTSPEKGTLQYLSGSFWSVHRDVIENIGYLYEGYFLYYEETEYCVRAAKSGFPLTHIPLDGIEHGDVSGLGRGSQLHRYYLARNHLLFVFRNAPPAVKLHEIARLPKTMYQHLVHRHRGAFRGDVDFLLLKRGKYTGRAW
jgi:GT2 family glycosyltransferase